MVKIIFETHKGAIHEVDAQAGSSVMESAISNMISGILADCGGSASCATCHVYVAPEWVDRIGPAADSERELLEMAIDPDETSRLSCQIKVTREIDGLRLKLPASQI